MTWVYCVFNLYVDGNHKRPAVNLRLMLGKSEISLRHLHTSNPTIILPVFRVKSKYSVRFQISQGNYGYYCQHPTATVRAYLKRSSFQNRTMYLRVSQDFS